jgi:hypothetical protein
MKSHRAHEYGAAYSAFLYSNTLCVSTRAGVVHALQCQQPGRTALQLAQRKGFGGIVMLLRMLDTKQKGADRAMKDSLRQASPETTKKQQEGADRTMKDLLEEEGQASATTVAVSQKKKQAKQAKAGKECHQTVTQGQDAEEQKDNLLQASPDKANDQMCDNGSTASAESHEVLEYPKLVTALFARELGRKSVKELREICRSKGIDTSACIDKRDLVDMIVSKPIVSYIGQEADNIYRASELT